MDLMCHVIATRVRSSGFWWASCWSALHSHVRRAIPSGSRVTVFVKSFFLICWQKGAPGIPTPATPAIPAEPSRWCKILPHKMHWSGPSGKSTGHKLPWSSEELGRQFRTNSFSSDLGIVSRMCFHARASSFLGGCTLACVRGPS